MQNGTSFLKAIGVLLILAITLTSCTNSSQNKARTTYQKSPVDILIRDMATERNFTILLLDMDFKEAEKKYFHKYQIINEVGDSIRSKETPWKQVNDIFFDANVNNMGMELASKKDGKLSKIAAPPGYSNYVGNKQYGQWKERDGSRFWEFYGKYAFMSSMFRMAMFPVRYSYWNDYNRNYYGRGRSYYGPMSNRGNMYGTNSSYTKSNTSSSWNKKPATFKSRVRSSVSRSATATKTRRARSTATRQSRNSSRYSRSNTRSRSGGFGK
ncbi:MAG: hypothetical protein JKY08_11215 [Flavobacteriaceae bacterium]|nr:hypothetical protein [Flavobacteriaceae bacterium]